jgi:hypothetical protein
LFGVFPDWKKIKNCGDGSANCPICATTFTVEKKPRNLVYGVQVRVLPIRSPNLALFIFLILFTSAIAFAQTTLHPTPIKRQIPFSTYETSEEPYDYFMKILADVGYEDTIPSLLYALYDEHPGVSYYALRLLRRFPDSPEVVAELNKAMDDDREGIMLGAAETLQRWGKTEWIAKAVERLPKMERRPKVRLSEILVRAGHTSGWKYVISPLLERHATTDVDLLIDALSAMALFNGKVGPDGYKIDVLSPLSDFAEMVAPEIRPKIIERIDEIRAYQQNRPKFFDDLPIHLDLF